MSTEHLLQVRALTQTPRRFIVDPVTHPLWNELVSNQQSDVFHSPAWIAVLRDTYDFEFAASVLVDPSSQPVAGMAYAEIRDGFDPRIVSLPFSDFCDPIAHDTADWYALADDLIASGVRVGLRCLHNSVPLDDDRFETADTLGWHCVDLNASADDLWTRLAPAARRAVRKARSQGVTVRAAESLHDLRAFFELHLRVRKLKYRLLAQPYPFFESIWKRFIEPGNGWLLLAEHEDAVVGGVMFLRWKDTLYYKFNASDPDALNVRPNDLVLWEGIRRASTDGIARLDFGVSDWDQEGLLRYKRKYATEEKVVHFLRHLPNGFPSDRERKARALLPQLTDLFVDPSVPHDVTERAGNMLYRYFT